MIDCGVFTIATVPRTGTTWVLEILAALGYREYNKNEIHKPWTMPSSGLRLTIVRNPCDWLASYWANVYPGCIGVPEVDVFRISDTSLTFEAYVTEYLRTMPGGIGALFGKYRADSVVRLEDFPYCMAEFFCMVSPDWGRDYIVKTCQGLGPQGIRPRKKPMPVWTDYLRSSVMEAEKAFCLDYEYC